MIRLGGSLGPAVDRLTAGRPSTPETSHEPSAWRRMKPKETPLVTRARAPPAGVASRIACKSVVIWRASISINPEPTMPRVARRLATVCNVTACPNSSTLPLVGSRSAGSKVTKSNRWPKTKTLVTKSPPPPAMPKGALWQPAQELASMAEIRLKACGNTSGSLGSLSGVPVPFVKGRPAPS